MNSIAAAKRRRAQPDNKAAMPIQPPVPQPPVQQPPQRMTPQQYLALLESKILALEKTVSSTKPSLQIEVNTPDGPKQLELSDYMSEMDQKFMVLAEEISSLKDSMLKLQSFTMNVNEKMFNRLQPVEQTQPFSVEPQEESSFGEPLSAVDEQSQDVSFVEYGAEESADDNELLISSGKKKGKKKN